MGIICACLPVCWPLILKLTSLSGLTTIGSSRHERRTSCAFCKRWHGRKPTTPSWGSSGSGTMGLSHRCRDERSKRTTVQLESEHGMNSEMELPILAAPSAVLPPAATAAAVGGGGGGGDDGHGLDPSTMYAPQVRIWSDAKERTSVETVRQGIQVDKAVHVVRRCEYPV